MLQLRCRNVTRKLNVTGAHKLPNRLDEAVCQEKPTPVKGCIKDIANADFNVGLFQTRPVQASQQVRQVSIGGEAARVVQHPVQCRHPANPAP